MDLDNPDDQIKMLLQLARHGVRPLLKNYQAFKDAYEHAQQGCFDSLLPEHLRRYIHSCIESPQKRDRDDELKLSICYLWHISVEQLDEAFEQPKSLAFLYKMKNLALEIDSFDLALDLLHRQSERRRITPEKGNRRFRTWAPSDCEKVLDNIRAANTQETSPESEERNPESSSRSLAPPPEDESNGPVSPSQKRRYVGDASLASKSSKRSRLPTIKEDVEDESMLIDEEQEQVDMTDERGESAVEDFEIASPPAMPAPITEYATRSRTRLRTQMFAKTSTVRKVNGTARPSAVPDTSDLPQTTGAANNLNNPTNLAAVSSAAVATYASNNPEERTSISLSSHALKPGTWLDDSVIYESLALILSCKQSWHLVDPQLVSSPHSVTDASALSSADYIMIPLHLGNHWALVILNRCNKEADFYDSLSAANNLQRARDALCSFFSIYMPQERWETWDFQDRPCLKQKNADDCGLLTIIHAVYLFIGRQSFPRKLHSVFWRRIFHVLLFGSPPVDWAAEDNDNEDEIAFSSLPGVKDNTRVPFAQVIKQEAARRKVLQRTLLTKRDEKSAAIPAHRVAGDNASEIDSVFNELLRQAPSMEEEYSKQVSSLAECVKGLERTVKALPDMATQRTHAGDDLPKDLAKFRADKRFAEHKLSSVRKMSRRAECVLRFARDTRRREVEAVQRLQEDIRDIESCTIVQER